MKLSFFHTVNLYGEAVRPICYENREKHKGHSSTLVHLELKRILEYQQYDVPKDAKKGQSGMCFCFVDPDHTYHNTENMRERGVTTDGIQFVDLDHLTEEEVNTIYNDFEKYCLALPCLQAISFSFSGNLHIFVKTPKLTASEFNKNLAIIYTAIIKTIKDISGIDVGREGIADDAMFKFAQRFFLCNSPYKWNDKCYEATFPDVTADQIHPLFRKYFKIQQPYIPENKNITRTVTIIDKPITRYIKHEERMHLFSSLAHLFNEPQLRLEWERCCEKMIEDNGHNKEFYKKEPYEHGTPWEKRGLYDNLLEEFGYTYHSTTNLFSNFNILDI